MALTWTVLGIAALLAGVGWTGFTAAALYKRKWRRAGIAAVAAVYFLATGIMEVTGGL